MKFKQLTINTLCFLLCLFCTIPAFAQKGRGITGVVTDEFGDPLPAASIAVMNNKKIARGANTNLYGEFAIEANLSDGDNELVVSYIGTKTVRIKLTPEVFKKPVEVVLKTDETMLADVTIVLLFFCKIT